MPFYTAQAGVVRRHEQPPAGSAPLVVQGAALLPPLISDLHRNFAAWAATGSSPGPVCAQRLWIGRDGSLAWRYEPDEQPRPLSHTGLAADLAAWLVLLDKWMETFVVVARARSVWSPTQLAGALTFMTPTYLPPELLAQPPDNWVRTAQAVALAVADGPLTGESANRHWVKREQIH